MSTFDFTDPNAGPATLHRLSNGRYEVLISDTGSGVSSCDGLALTRWHADPVEDDLGTIVYLRDLDDGRFRSLGYQPTRTPAGVYRPRPPTGVSCWSGRMTVSRRACR